jgi:hypothetical protein
MKMWDANNRSTHRCCESVFALRRLWNYKVAISKLIYGEFRNIFKRIIIEYLHKFLLLI